MKAISYKDVGRVCYCPALSGCVIGSGGGGMFTFP